MEDLTPDFGDRLLRYLLATEGEKLPTTPTEAQQAVIDHLRQLITEVKGEEIIAKTIHLQDALLAYVDNHQSTAANILRAQCGGELLAIDVPDDPVAAHLLRLGRDIYPGYLLPHLESYGALLASPSANALRHPASTPLARLILADARLGLLFPGNEGKTPEGLDELIKINSYIVVSSGHGGGVQLPTLPGRLLKNAFERMILSGKNDVASYLDLLLIVLEDMRRLAEKKEIQVPVAVGLGNLKLPDGQQISFSGIELRQTRPDDSRWQLPFGTLANAVLTVTTPLKLLRIKDAADVDNDKIAAEFEKFNSGFDAARKSLQRRVELVRFALLLASPTSPYHAAQQGTTRIFDPLYEFAVTAGPSYAPSPSPETTVEVANFGAVESWLHKVQAHPVKLDIAMRRLLGAATTRFDPLDGLIDAVLAWENMFSGAPETNLRVCGAISLLLEPGDFKRRKALFDELKRLYTARSALVHGSSEPNPLDASTMRDRAVDIGLQAVRRLYDHAELLSLDSPARGLNVLLGAVQSK